MAISKLHVEGRHIKDAIGRTVYLRGVNQAGSIDNPNGWWNPEGGTVYSGLGVWSPDAVKYNLDNMKSWGCNVIRLHTSIQWWVENTNNYRQHFRDIITWAGEREIYVIFDAFSITGSMQYELPWGSYIPAEQQAIMPSEQAFVDYWVTVANELKDSSNVIFELYNEPHGDDTARDAWFRVVQQCIDTIRGVGANQIIIVQWDYGAWVNLDYPPPDPHNPDEYPCSTLSWVEDYPLTDPTGNIAYSFHNYRGQIHRQNGARVDSYTYADMKLGFETCLVDYVLNTLNKPVIVGEVGADMWKTGDELTNELAYFNNTLTIFNEWNMSYVAWVWTIPAHMRWGLLQNEGAWLPPPNEAGEALINAIAGVTPPEFVTPWTGELEEKTYRITMPQTVLDGTDTYRFVEWQDGVTDRSRIIDLTADVMITATYELAPPTSPVILIMAPLTVGFILTIVGIT